MTKNEFDAAFLAGRCCVRVDTTEQWFTINEYERTQFDLKKSSAYLSHNCMKYPFVYCHDMIVDAIRINDGFKTISFAEFAAATQAENEEDILCGSLEDVL